MTEQERKKVGGSKLSRSETVTVRLDPKLRYLAELASRKQRRTLSSFIEWAIEDTLSRIVVSENNGYSKSISEVASDLWDVDESDRLVKLALNHPDLLTHDEQILWKLIKETPGLWRGKYDGNDEWTWLVKEGNFQFDKLHDNWESFKAVASGTAKKDILPAWIISKYKRDDEIPF